MSSEQRVSNNTETTKQIDALLESPVIFFKALADETRLSALMLLVNQGELCVCELVEAMEVSQPKISRHLALLRQQGIISDRRQGIWVHYRINEQLPDWAKQALTMATENNHAFFESSLARLQQMGNRPERQSSCC